MNQPAAREVISPEGVEERVEIEEGFRMTLTGGGKYRIYHLHSSGVARAMETYDNKEAATKAMGEMMGIFGMLMADPKRTMEALLSGRKKDVKL